MSVQKNNWKLIYNRFAPQEEGLREALCTLGNGCFATRGAATEAVPSEDHYPGTYIAGVYNLLPTRVDRRTVYNEDLVNCPNWLYLTFRIGGAEWFCPSASRITAYRLELDMKTGLLTRFIRFRNSDGRRTRVTERRLVSMDNPHLGAFQYIIEPENYGDRVCLRTMLDGAVINMNVERYRELSFHHLRPKALGVFAPQGVYLNMRTSQSKIDICQAAKLRVFLGEKEKKPPLKIVRHAREVIGQEFGMFVPKGQTFIIEKTAAVFTSRDSGVRNPAKAAVECAVRAPRFERLYAAHRQAWAKLWRRADVRISGHVFSQQAVRFHIFHLLQTASPHNRGIDAGLPARGLHGEAYRGHIFWDEIFALGFYDTHFPRISRALLRYRRRRLAPARAYARENGYRGAMFPWQSGSSGKEETQQMHLNPLSGTWGPDHSRLQRHVSFAVGYNAWRHWHITGNRDFLDTDGAELIVSTAKFGASLAYYDARDRRFHTRRIMGPDEFHEKYPRAARPGLKDNAYTNFMIVWTLLRAREVLARLAPPPRGRLMRRLKIGEAELRRWDRICRKMNLEIRPDRVISQFGGYFRLKELDWRAYRKRYGDISRMDRILKAEGKSPDDYKVSKQADALMIFYLFSAAEIREIFSRLGYSCSMRDCASRKTRDLSGFLEKNYDYYEKRTSHGSTLSKVVHCYLALLLGRQREQWHWFMDVLRSDIEDTQGGTTPEGIHTGVMGGSLDIIMRGFAGISFGADQIYIDPRLPRPWKKIKFSLLYRATMLMITLTHAAVTVRDLSGKTSGGREMPRITVCGVPRRLRPGKSIRMMIPRRRQK